MTGAELIEWIDRWTKYELTENQRETLRNRLDDLDVRVVSRSRLEIRYGPVITLPSGDVRE